MVAQPFDTRRLALTGDPFLVAEEIQMTSGLIGSFAASESGVLVYQTGIPQGMTQLAWIDRTGKQLSVLGDPGSTATCGCQQMEGRQLWPFATQPLKT